MNEGVRLANPPSVRGNRGGLSAARSISWSHFEPDVFLAAHGGFFGLRDKAERTAEGRDPESFRRERAVSKLAAADEGGLRGATGTGPRSRNSMDHAENDWDDRELRDDDSRRPRPGRAALATGFPGRSGPSSPSFSDCCGSPCAEADRPLHPTPRSGPKERARGSAFGGSSRRRGAHQAPAARGERRVPREMLGRLSSQPFLAIVPRRRRSRSEDRGERRERRGGRESGETAPHVRPEETLHRRSKRSSASSSIPRATIATTPRRSSSPRSTRGAVAGLYHAPRAASRRSPCRARALRAKRLRRHALPRHRSSSGRARGRRTDSSPRGQRQLRLRGSGAREALARPRNTSSGWDRRTPGAIQKKLAEIKGALGLP